MTTRLRKIALKLIRFWSIFYLIILNFVTFRFASLKLVLRNLSLSSSQNWQDLYALAFFFRRGLLNPKGYFIDFGATNGVSLSNSLIFERHFGFNGILAEPAKIWHADLVLNRQCAISFKCVWRASGENLEFNEASNPDLSGIASTSNQRSDLIRQTYLVETISFNDLLNENNAPSRMQMLSIDTEGSEFEILSSLDHMKYQFDMIICEHNYSKNRKQIRQLLEANGYHRKFLLVSFWDDWYFLE